MSKKSSNVACFQIKGREETTFAFVEGTTGYCKIVSVMRLCWIWFKEMPKAWFYVARVLYNNFSHAILLHALLPLRNLYVFITHSSAMPEVGNWETLGMKLGFGQTQQRTEVTGAWVLAHRHWLPGCSIEACTSRPSDLGRMRSRWLNEQQLPLLLVQLSKQ